MLQGRIDYYQVKGVLVPGQYAFACPCGYTKRVVSDSEVFFQCERPIEPKVPKCEQIHHLPSLVAALDNRLKRREAEEFVATHDEKLAEARRVLSETTPENSKSTKVLKAPRKLKGKKE